MNRLLVCLGALLCHVVAFADPPEVGWPDLSKAAPVQGGGEKDVALIIGISDYDKLADIPGSAENAKDWSKYFIETRKLSPENVFLVTDGNATREEMLRKLDALVEASKAGGTLWFVYIGHGYSGEDPTEKKESSGYLVGVDARADVDNLKSRSLMQSELFEKLGKGNQSNTNVILDACFSGKTPNGDFLMNTGLMVSLPPLPPEKAVKKKVPEKKQKTFVVMTATAEDQFAGPLPNASRPAFSYLVLGAMRGWAANDDNTVTAQEAVDYAASILRHASDRKQTPQVKGPGSQVLSTGSESKPDTSAAILPKEAPMPSEKPAVKMVKLKINSNPEGARIYFNNAPVGLTPFDAPAAESKEDRITILIEKEGFLSKKETVIPDQEKEVNIILEVDPNFNKRDVIIQEETPLQKIAPISLILAGTGAGAASILMDRKYCIEFFSTSELIKNGTPIIQLISGVSLGGLWVAFRQGEDVRASILAGAGTTAVVSAALLSFRQLCHRIDFGEPPVEDFGDLPKSPQLRGGAIIGLGVTSVASFAAAYVTHKRSKEKKASLEISPTVGGSMMSFSLSW